MNRVSVGVLVAVLAVPSMAHAGSILFAGSGPSQNGTPLSASALFEISGSTLTMTLSNLGGSAGAAESLALSGVFFDLPTGVTLTPASAAIPTGSTSGAKCSGPSCGPATDVGGAFAYKSGSWEGHQGNHGISSGGYIDADMAGGNFSSTPGSLDGLDFGIVAPLTRDAFDPASSLVEGEVVFTMTIAGGTLLESAISNVSFQYGTDLNEPRLPGGMVPAVRLPEPSVLLLFSLAAAAALRRRPRTKGSR